MIGVVFADESEAKVFFKKVTSRKTGNGTISCPLSGYLFTLLMPLYRESKIGVKEEGGEGGQD